MFTRSLWIRIAIMAVIVAAVSCAIFQKNDSEQDVRLFLGEFEKKLAGPEKDVLSIFQTKQSREVVLTAVNILQNKETEFIVCEAAFSSAEITIGEKTINVSIPVTFKSKNVENDHKQESKLMLELQSRKKSFVITSFNGEEFYKPFGDLKNNIQWSVERQLELRKREPIYALAKMLQLKFDSVIWFTTYKDKRYFYVVKGKWDRGENGIDALKRGDYKMGLIDDEGKILIPVEYDLIGAIGFSKPGQVEVQREGHVGYFDIFQQIPLFDPVYDQIIPYEQGETMAIVKIDTTYGWLDKSYHYSAGLPSTEAKAWLSKFSFIPTHLKLKGDSTLTFCEIPNAENAGSGIFIPPTYLVKSGLFEELMPGFSTTKVPINGWTEYKRTDGMMLQSLTDKISAVMTTITARYLEGREEFYTYNRLVFVNQNQDTLNAGDVYSSKQLDLHLVDSTLLELKAMYEDYEMGGEGNFYQYYRLGANNVVAPLRSHRNFAASEFVKLDSSYFLGKFYEYDETLQDYKTFNFTPESELISMRNDILADYGFAFTDPELIERYNGREWYHPKYTNVSDFEDQLTDIDRHNLKFLDSVIKSAPKI